MLLALGASDLSSNLSGPIVDNTKEQKLRELEEEINSFVEKQIHKRPVPGEGSADAVVMFIGEAAGAEEEKTGRPFVGRSGKLLTEFIEKTLGIPRKDVYITSIVKWRPPENRTPKAEEVKRCLDFVKKQIELIKPQLIVPLGNVALQSLLGKEMRIGQSHGRTFSNDIGNFFPVFHPAAVLRGTIKREIVEGDFRKIRKLISD